MSDSSNNSSENEREDSSFSESDAEASDWSEDGEIHAGNQAAAAAIVDVRPYRYD